MPNPAFPGLPREFPPPEADAREHSARLCRVIAGEIEAQGGRIPFDRFMELALYSPGLGYYAAGSIKLGASGDFVTAPELSPLFAQAFARQCEQVLGRIEGGDILEFGAGSGVFAADLLQELERLGRLPTRYRVLEPSPQLRERQRATLAARSAHLATRVEWVETFPAAGFRGIVVANEVLDAMPVHRFRTHAGRLEEEWVHMSGESFESHFEAPASSPLSAAAKRILDTAGPFEDGYQSEVNLRLAPWIKGLSSLLEEGVVFLVDYGYPRKEYYHPQRTAGTLMCHYRHRAHPDPLILVGLQDITAHVDFTAVAEAGSEAGLRLAGYTTQAHFLMGCGIHEIAARSDPEDAAAHLRMTQGLKTLLLPSEMGERFKVIALARSFETPLHGFALNDMRERL